MYFTGFADEAADSIEGQLQATKELGWDCIEFRNANSKSFHNLTDDEFEEVASALEKADVKINCVGSAIANWGCSILSPFEQTIDLVKQTIKRMKRLNSNMVRIMSYSIIRDTDEQYEQERFKRVSQIKHMFEDSGITAVHENCMNYGGMSAKHTLKLIENVSGLKLVFDTANPVFTNDYSKPAPYPKQSSWEFYSAVKDHIAYIHIKDCVYISENENGIFPKCKFTFPGEGDGEVERILTDLLASGYDGGISIEPHLSKVFHETDQSTVEAMRYDSYIEYGKRLMTMIENINSKLLSAKSNQRLQ